MTHCFFFFFKMITNKRHLTLAGLLVVLYLEALGTDTLVTAVGVDTVVTTAAVYSLTFVDVCERKGDISAGERV